MNTEICIVAARRTPQGKLAGALANYSAADLAVAAGKPILCEKPIDLSLERVNACWEKIRDKNVPIMLGFVRRFDPGHRATRDAVRSPHGAQRNAG